MTFKVSRGKRQISIPLNGSCYLTRDALVDIVFIRKGGYLVSVRVTFVAAAAVLCVSKQERTKKKTGSPHHTRPSVHAYVVLRSSHTAQSAPTPSRHRSPRNPPSQQPHQLINQPAQISPHQLRARTHDLKIHLPSQSPPALHAPALQPRQQVLALADVKDLELVAALEHAVDADARDAHAAADGELAQVREVQAQGAEGGVRDGAAAEGEVEVREVGAAEGQDFGGGVGEGATEGLGV